MLTACPAVSDTVPVRVVLPWLNQLLMICCPLTIDPGAVVAGQRQLVACRWSAGAGCRSTSPTSWWR